jgi:hypothetical protein
LKYLGVVEKETVTNILETVQENSSTKVSVRVSQLGFKQREKNEWRQGRRDVMTSVAGSEECGLKTNKEGILELYKNI